MADPRGKGPLGTEPVGIVPTRYRRTAVISTGPTATVHRAEDLLLGREVAVKVFSGGSDAEALGRQEAEARLLASLSMHGLVTLLDAGVEHEAAGTPRMFLVLELVDGPDLGRVLEQGPLVPRQVGHIAVDVAEALAYLHAHGVVHGDLKPGNVLLLGSASERRPRVKLADFGMTGIVGPRDDGDAYRSPEQAVGRPPGPASDVYAFGLVLLHCLTGRPPAGGPASVPEDLPADWRRVLTGMLAIRPEDRPDPESLAETFRALVLEETGRHRGADDPRREADRLAAVRAYGVLDTPPDAPFDRITSLAVRVFRVPMAAVGILDADRVWFKSAVGLDVREIRRPSPLHRALLEGALATAGGAPVVIPDAAADPRTAADGLVIGPPSVRFAAAAPLVTVDGFPVGLVAIYDTAPGSSTPELLDTLTDLAAIVLHELELRRAARRVALARR